MDEILNRNEIVNPDETPETPPTQSAETDPHDDHLQSVMDWERG